MIKQIPIHRLKKGVLIFDSKIELEFIIGLVYHENGNYLFELHFDEEINLKEFYSDHKNDLLNSSYSINCKTDEGHLFSATNIWLKTIPFSRSMAIFTCSGQIRIEKESHEEPNSVNRLESSDIKYVVVEGLKMCHSEHTYIQAQRNSRDVESYEFGDDKLWDHSVVTFRKGYQNYRFAIYEASENTSILEFLKPEAQYLSVTYNQWLELKRDFVFFLSFLNGARVAVRSEHFGEYYTVGQPDAHVNVFYSFEKNVPNQWNDFIPIQNEWYKGDHLVERAFFWCFDKYRELNRQLDLNSIVFYLNNIEQSASIGERIFVQTILLERFSDKYAETFSDDSTKIIDEEKFDEIKEQLQEVLKSHKKDLKDHFNLLNSKISNLNYTKRKQTDFKFRELIKGARIDINERIENLLLQRHDIVHKGDIGENELVYQNYKLMDKLIRHVLINLIGYKASTIDTGNHLAKKPDPIIKTISP